MSWDKNTVRDGVLDHTLEVLKDLKVPFVLKVIGKVQGFGINDQYSEAPYWEIRKLSYKNFVLLEQIHRSSNCDSDDVIITHKFLEGEEPKEWPLEVLDERNKL